MQHADLLAQIPLFEGLSDDDRNALAARLTEKKYKANDTVFAKGDIGQSMYIVLTGSAQIYLPPPEDADKETPRVVLKDVRSGEYFGELSLFDDKPRSASVEATVDTVLLELTRDELAEHLAKSKNAALAILSEMAERLRETNALLSQRAAKDVLKEIEENLTWGQRLADRVAELNGSWALLAGKKPDGEAAGFDPYPFVFFNLLLAIIVSLQGPLIVMSQNRQTMKDRKQAETDFRVNLKNEVGIESLQRELAAFKAESLRRLETMERSSRMDRVRSEIQPKTPGRPGNPLA
jgi:uncharacterized membrane protein